LLIKPFQIPPDMKEDQYMNKQHNKILTALFAMVIMASTAANIAQAGESKEKEAKELKLFSQAKFFNRSNQISGEKGRRR
jgi:hypothetical protein